MTKYNSTNIAGGGLKVAPDTVNLTFTFLGKEAGNTNYQLLWDNTVILTNTDSVPTTHSLVGYSTASSNGWVPLTFKTNGHHTGNPNAYIKNGTEVSANGGGLYMAFSEIFVGGGVHGGVLGETWIYAFFGDGLGDHDFDDMVVKIAAFSQPGGSSTSPVPLPPALVLFGSGLMGLVSLGRYRRRKAATRR